MFAQTKMDAASRAAEKELEKLRMTVIVRQRQEYRRALDELRRMMGDIYAKYAKDGVLTYSQMTQYNRLKSLYANIKETVKGLYDWQKKEIPMLISDSFEEAYFRYGYTFQAGGLDMNWGLLSNATIKASVDIPISGLPVSEILTKNNYDFYLKARQEITQGLIQGESIDEMAKRIKEVTEVSASKSETVARTESTRAAGQGQVEAYDRAEALGVEFDRVWVATLDDRTRDSHGLELDGQHADEDNLFHATGNDGQDYTAEAPGGFGEASLDINCFPENVFVNTNSKISKCYKRKYKGKLYTITTSGGNKITGTPNHPILSDKGWIALNQINKNTNLVTTNRNVKFLFNRRPYINNRPTMIAEIFDFFKIIFPVQRKSTTRKDFHGDGFDSYVDIINIDSLLFDTIKSSMFKFIKKFFFPFTYFGKTFLNSIRAFNSIFFRSNHSTNSVMSFFGKLLSTFRRCLFHAFIHGFAAISCFISYVIEIIINNCPTASDRFSNLFNRFTGFVSFDNVVDVNVKLFHGYVYNLQTNNNKYFVTDITQSGNYKVNYFIVHNCRCRVIAEVKDFPPVALEGYENLTYDEWKAQQE